MIVILDGGPQTTVQDLGRFGQLRYGIPPSGPVDGYAFVLANRLVGNSDSAAALECTVMGARFQVHVACAIAITGAEMPVTINGSEAPRWNSVMVKSGDVIKLGAARAGVRTYIAFSGGVNVPAILGSRSTYLRGGLGGLEGRALRKHDRVSLLPAPLPRTWRVAADRVPDYSTEPEIRVVLGPQTDRFSESGIAAFLNNSYEMLPQSDRMGARLRGERVSHRRGHDIISDGIALGSVQVAGDGQPIILLVDRQSTGGYTKLATVCSFDIGRVGQVKPGRSLRFRAVGVDEAHRLLREHRALLESDLSEKE
ncbi:MAG: 5-oxoprolinase subunit C family protein [Burkholderiales bacterium]